MADADAKRGSTAAAFPMVALGASEGGRGNGKANQLTNGLSRVDPRTPGGPTDISEFRMEEITHNEGKFCLINM